MQAVLQMAANETYLELERWVYALVWETRRRWPLLDGEEVLRTAFFAYSQAYDTYNPKKGSLTNWVTNKIRGAMKNLIREEITKAKRAARYIKDFDLQLLPLPEQPQFNLEEWMSRLSPDGQKVAKLVFNPPIDIRVLLKQIGEKRKLAWRLAIKEFLRECNWSNRRIRKVFTEIKESL